MSMDLKLTAVAVVLAFGAAALLSRIDCRGGATKPTPGAARPADAAAGPGYPSLLADVDRRAAGLRTRAEGRPDDWLTRQHLGTVLLERARLTNRLEDYLRVQAVLDDAFSLAPRGSGPLVLAARFHYTVHRLTRAEEYLDLIDRRAVPRAADTLLARVLRAEIALQRGQYQVAGDELKAVAKQAPAVATVELALYYAKTGDPAQAETLLSEALTATPVSDLQRRAWLQLQLGVVAMNRGDLTAAMKRLRAADAELPGWWLVQEHIAEVHSRLDEHAKAIEILEALVESTDLPQHMDTLAGLYRHVGRADEAEALIARARERWEQHLASLPEATRGHALQHYLRFGPPERALELAREDAAARPGGDAQLALAQALLKIGQPAEALAVLQQVLATPYRSARLHDLAARAYTALGDAAAAEAQTELCWAINPRYSGDDHSH